jgi:hypothetical protein
MMHMKQIQQQFDQGLVEQAEQALDNLLELGPKNTEALKMRAMLYERCGQFMQESKIWERIGKIDGEDRDYLEYLERRQNEERERFFFTDELPGGGRRFLAYPRGVIYASAAALLGCLFFLIFARSATAADPTKQTVTLTVFGVCVLAPWVAIAIAYLRTIRSVSVSETGLEVALRFREVTVNWTDMAHAWIVHHIGPRNPQLALVLIPKDNSAAAISIDLMQGSTAIRARSQFVKDVERHIKDLETVRLTDVFEKHLSHRPILSV